MSKIILEVHLKSLADSVHLPVLDITPSATACHFRLVDCARYVHHRTLSICELTEFPPSCYSYAAISYVWKGNSVDESTVGSRFIVAGAEDGDPIGVEALLHACTAALREDIPYIWLDRLCIMQTDSNDKAWQIERMFAIYQGSTLCLVLPGGIQRLIRLDETTTWITRGWTLQEALAPPRVEVIYSWQYGSGMYY
ncbi:hypothetical protein M422DRAFT_182064, partial [Sphaerobolus stellatus SS14]